MNGNRMRTLQKQLVRYCRYNLSSYRILCSNTNIIITFISTDATTLLGTNRKSELDNKKSNNPKIVGKLTKDDFKTVYFDNIVAEDKLNPKKDKSVDLTNDQYEVVDSSYICIRIDKE